MRKSKIDTFLESTGPGILPEGMVTIVMGNEAADLDSMASAVLYAYYLSLDDPSHNPKALINIPRGDFKLRTEATFLFNEAGIDESVLNFSEDVDLKKLFEENRLRLVLVDHNKLASSQAYLEQCIVEILDHHTDEERYPSTAVTDIRPVGSTATLVAERYLQKAEEVIDNSLGTLLLGTILLDTVNLDPEAGRVTDTDSTIAKNLVNITKADMQTLFDKLQFEKFNVSSLASYDLLRKDYKQWRMGSVMCGIGSVLMSAEEWKQKDPELKQAFKQYASEKQLDVLIAMNAFTQPSFTRHLGVYVSDPELRENLLRFLESSDLGLEKFDALSEKDGVLFYNQKNLGMSRKKLHPVLSEFFQS